VGFSFKPWKQRNRKSSSRKRSQLKRKRHRQSRYESLEVRHLLAGDFGDTFVVPGSPGTTQEVQFELELANGGYLNELYVEYTTPALICSPGPEDCVFDESSPPTSTTSVKLFTSNVDTVGATTSLILPAGSHLTFTLDQNAADTSDPGTLTFYSDPSLNPAGADHLKSSILRQSTGASGERDGASVSASYQWEDLAVDSKLNPYGYARDSDFDDLNFRVDVLGYSETPQVSVSAIDSTAAENSSNAAILRFQRVGGSTDQALTVDFEIDGSAVPGDFKLSGGSVSIWQDSGAYFGSVTIAAGSSRVNVDLSAVDDALSEGPEVATFRVISNGTTDYVPAGAAASISIQDDEQWLSSVAVGSTPIAVEIGPVDGDSNADAVTLGADGKVSVALGTGLGTWDSVNVYDLSLGAAVGMAGGQIDGDDTFDLVIQGPDGLSVLASDGIGGFAVTQSLNPTSTGELAAGTQIVNPELSFFDDDFSSDLAVVVPGTDELLIYLNDGQGAFGNLVRYASGGDQPISVSAGQLVGDAHTDLVVGHADGTLTFFEGNGDGTFSLRTDLTVTGLGSIADVVTGDFDLDGETDVVVSSGTSVTLLTADADPQSEPSIENGDFSQGLIGWNTEIVGHSRPSEAGTVNAQSEIAQLTENGSFIVGLNQKFSIPASAQTLSFDLISLGLEPGESGIPDAFEVSLLNNDNESLVATFQANATSFLNAAPDGTVQIASGVTFDGTTVTVDITALPAGTEATLYFDLIGNPTGQSSSIMLDNVVVSPGPVLSDTFSLISLAGPFVDAAGMRVADIDGDGTKELLVADAGADRVVVFYGNEDAALVREEIDLSSFGSEPVAIATGTLTPGDNVDDLAVVLMDASLLVSPSALDSGSSMMSGSSAQFQSFEGGQACYVYSSTAPPKFFVADSANDTSYQYDDEGNFVGGFEISATESRGIGINSIGDTLWYVDQTGQVYVHSANDGSTLGSWQATGISDAQGITIDDSDIWIVDATTDSILHFVGAASLRSGSDTADASFSLVAENSSPSGITTNGEVLWVSDDLADKVFVYDLTGTLLGSWALIR